MKPVWTAFGAGGVFGAGLVVSGMVKPGKVIGFLDFSRHWDPSLALVMVGAIAVHMTLFRLILKRRSPFYDSRFHLPTRKDIDVRLVLGAAVFGVGWGLGGFCPGPGLVSVGAGVLPSLVFVIAMTAGMYLESLVSKVLAKPSSPSLPLRPNETTSNGAMTP